MTAIYIALIVSLFLNGWLFYLSRKIKKEPTQDARELLHYLTKGGALVRLEILDPSGLLFYRGHK